MRPPRPGGWRKWSGSPCAIFGVDGALARDIGRQRQRPVPEQGRIEVGAAQSEAEHALPVGAPRFENRIERIVGRAEPNALGQGQLLRRAQEGAPEIGALPLVQHRLDPRRAVAAATDAGETRRDDPRVVHDEDVSRRERGREIAQMTVFECACRVDRKETRRLPRLDRPQGDVLLRQIEIEEVDAHDPPVSRMTRPEGC